MWNVFSLIYFPSVYVFDKVCVKIFGSLFIFSYLSYYCWILSVILNNSLLLDSENCSAIRLFATPRSVCGILQTRILEWVAIPFFRGSSWPRSPALKPHSLPSELPGKPFIGYVFCKYFIPVWLVSCSWQCLAGKKKKKKEINFDDIHLINWWRKLATHTRILAWKIPCTEEPGGWAIVHRVTKESDTT